MVRISPIVSADLDAVLDLIHQLAAYHGDTSDLTRDDLRRDALGQKPWITVLVARQADEVVGYVALCPLIRLQFGMRGVDIHHLFVVSPWRRKGVGRKLIDSALAWAHASRCRYVTVGTLAANPTAALFYRSVGFDVMPPPGPRFSIRLPAG